jgi:hypothetical protein
MENPVKLVILFRFTARDGQLALAKGGQGHWLFHNAVKYI